MSDTGGGGITQQQINQLFAAQAQAPALSAPNWGTTNVPYNGPASFNGQQSNYRPAGAQTMGDPSQLPPQLRNTMFSLWGAPIGTVDPSAQGGYRPFTPQQQAALYQSLGINAQQAQNPGPGMFGSWPSATGNNPYPPSSSGQAMMQMSPQTMANVNQFARGPQYQPMFGGQQYQPMFGGFGGFGGLGFMPW